MAILVKNQTVEELLKYLEKHSDDLEVSELYESLLEDKIEAEINELKEAKEYPKPTKGGAWIV
jgi:hypothetical protein